MKTKVKVEVEFDVLPARLDDVKHLIDLFEKELAAMPANEQWRRNEILSRLYPLVSAYAMALSNGNAEDVALVHLQMNDVQAKSDERKLALEKFKVRSIHWTIRLVLAAIFGIAWGIFA